MVAIMSTNLVSDNDGDQPVSVLGAACYEDGDETSSGRDQATVDEDATETPVDVEEYQADASHDNALAEIKDETAPKSTADVEQEGVSLVIKSSPSNLRPAMLEGSHHLFWKRTLSWMKRLLPWIKSLFC